MRLLFFDGASRCRVDPNRKIYTGSNLESSIVERYGRYCDELAVLLIEERENCNAEEHRQVDEIDIRNVEVSPVPDIYRPRINYFNIKLRQKVVEVIAREIQKADRVIVRAPGRFYTNTALKLCRKYKRPYLIEVVDFVGDFMSFARIKKVFAPYCEYTAKREIARAPYVVYVTQKALQERYPTSGKAIGCSDVELPELKSPIRKNNDGGVGINPSLLSVQLAASANSKAKNTSYVPSPNLKLKA